MPFNPCGRVVDFGRSSYRTRCRFFRDSEVEADIVWYPALPDAPVLGFPSAITSSEWDVQERDGTYPHRTGVGEVPGAPRRRLRPTTKRAATGAHVCGTRSDHEFGASYNPSITPRLYRADGLPVCCAPGEGLLFGAAPGAGAQPAGGLLVSTPYPAASGGLLLGGAPVRAPSAGGLLWTTPAEPGPAYCHDYAADPMLGVSTYSFTPDSALPPWLSWHSTTDGYAVRLYSPDQYGPGEPWTITTDTGGRWVPFGSWDGTGIGVFVRVAGSGPATVFVECDD